MEFPTGIGTSTADEISLLGCDLATDLLGKISFGELAYWLMSSRRPTHGQALLFNAVLISLADHGFTPTAIAARSTYYSAPDSLQGAVASGLLGGGSRFLGVTEDTGLFLDKTLDEHPGERSAWGKAEWDDLARAAVRNAKEDGRKVPGLGHPVHKQEDPRTPVLIELARREGVLGDRIKLFEAIGRVHPEILGKKLPLNGAGVCGAVLRDIGLQAEIIRGVSLLARTAGLLGHIAEEQRRPVGPAIYAAVDRNAVYRPLES